MGRAFARAGLLGNPSDGYGGKAIGVPVRNFAVRVSITRADSVTVSAGGETFSCPDLGALVSGGLPPSVDGLERLVLATVLRFTAARPSVIDGSAHSGMNLECSTTIPRQVGLAGSSATIIATLRALCDYFATSISKFDTAEMALATEVHDLGIVAGPLDRVIQSYEQAMVLDLAGPRSEASYRALDAGHLPPLLLARTPSTGRPSGQTHSDLRERWERRDNDVVQAMAELRDVVDRGVAALESDDREAFADAVDRNYALRLSVTDVTEADANMVAIAIRHGAAAKLCGSGGTVLIAPRAHTDLASLERAYAAAGFPSVRPEIV